jgi:hypothetical protein
MILMLMFGSIGVPAIADATSSTHMVELLDLECHEADSNSEGSKDAPVAPAGHIDHHHCSVAVPNHPVSVAADAIFANGKFLIQLIYELTSLRTAPPTEPPAA